ncbi:MAG TPA: STELLO glycosyltransferase family protein [Chthoniobacterales bacterium]|nr:STELLO glycosyltransferase family protein [Chthoniobacterales bacterium]
MALISGSPGWIAVNESPAIVVTSIFEPSPALREIAEGAAAADYQIVVIGDANSRPDFNLQRCDYYDLARQKKSGLRFAELCPTRHYARKNIGYLLAARAGAPFILETDDDNFPQQEFWRPRQLQNSAPVLRSAGWVNVYRYFTEANIWPRGLPLDAIHHPPPGLSSTTEEVACPIQQGLADANPDVDAIYRITLPLPQTFRRNISVALGAGSWCPFNSQNTAWWPDAYPLLYLPAHCSFRVTDIWRSFVAQRIAWTNDWHILFQSPDVTQERNPHNLLRDFADEIPGYLQNRAICEALAKLELQTGVAHIGDNLRACYQALVRGGWLPDAELELLEAWLEDLR